MLENEFRVIGRLISYYRKLYKYHVNDFLVNMKDYYINYCKTCNECNNLETICSKRTLYKIEDGNRIRKDCYYIRLCENLNMDILFEQKYYDDIYKIRRLLYENLVDFNAENLMKVLEKIENKRITFKITIYIKEMLALYMSIIQYKLYRKLPSYEDLSVFVYLKDIVDEYDKKLILYLLYDLLFKISVENYTRETLMDECKDYFNDPLFFRMKLTSHVSDDHISGLLYLMSIDQKNLNLYQKYCIQDLSALAYMNIKDYKHSYLCLNECQLIIESGLKLSNTTLINYYRKKGIVSFANEDYEGAANSFFRVVNEGNSLGANYALLFYSLEKTGQKDRIMEVLNKIDIMNIKNMNIKNILKYYKTKFDSNTLNKSKISYLETIICEDIAPNLYLFGELFSKVFKEDLMKFVKITSNYSKLYIYESCVFKENEL